MKTAVRLAAFVAICAVGGWVMSLSTGRPVWVGTVRVAALVVVLALLVSWIRRR